MRCASDDRAVDNPVAARGNPPWSQRFYALSSRGWLHFNLVWRSLGVTVPRAWTLYSRFIPIAGKFRQVWQSSWSRRALDSGSDRLGNLPRRRRRHADVTRPTWRLNVWHGVPGRL